MRALALPLTWWCSLAPATEFGVWDAAAREDASPAPPCRSSAVPGGGLAVPAELLVRAARLGARAAGWPAALIPHRRHSRKRTGKAVVATIDLSVDTVQDNT